MASSPSGEVFAAFRRCLPPRRLTCGAVPMATSLSSGSRTPFPGYVVASHPRLRIAPTARYMPPPDSCQTLRPAAYYVLSQPLHRRAIGRQPTQPATRTVVYPSVDFGSNVQGSALDNLDGTAVLLRCGAASEGGGDASACSIPAETRTLGAFCAGCSVRSGSSRAAAIFPAGDSEPASQRSQSSVNPILLRGRVSSACPDLASVVRIPLWQASDIGLCGPRNLGYADGQAFTIPVDIVQNTPVCSDTRGYWGDYDDMLLTGFTATAAATGVRFVTDSSKGCTSDGIFGQTQHVQASRYSY